MELGRGFEPGYKATALPFEPSSIDIYVVKIIYQSYDIIFSKQMTDPPFTLLLELPYLQYPLSVGHLQALFLNK
jgi:hypothetical protein